MPFYMFVYGDAPFYIQVVEQVAEAPKLVRRKPLQ